MVVWLILLTCTANAFYIPGVAQKTFTEGSAFEIFVNKLESTKTHLPFGYYYLNYCQPKNKQSIQETLGQILQGDKIESSDYQARMMIDNDCAQLCPRRNSKNQIDNFRWMIDNQYISSWVIDNLPVGYLRTVQYEKPVSVYQDGFPIGYKDPAGNYFIYNHVNIVVLVHPVDDEKAAYRIVGALAEPLSIKHESDENGTNLKCKDPMFANTFFQNLDENLFTNVDVIKEDLSWQDQNNFPLQRLDDSDIIYSYSVKFVESEKVWGSRWDIYLNSDTKSDDIHWLSIINSFAMVLFLSGMVAHILRRTVNKAVTYYNERADMEVSEETGWKQVHGDVFRTPSYPGIFSIIVGSGVQVIGMSFLTLIFASLGFLSPAHRGGLLTTMILLFVFMGTWAGYASARVYKMFGGEMWKRNTVGTALFFPGLCFGVFFTINLSLYFEDSSASVSFLTLFLMLLLWFGISVPLVFLGSAIGYKKNPIEKSCKVNRIPKPLTVTPDQFKMKVICLMAGSLPFGCMFIELSYLMKFIWTSSVFYYLFGFMMLCLIVLIITSAEVSILMSYILLCKEDYRWWWLSIGVAGSSGLYLFLYSIIYCFVELQMTRFSSYLLYFGYMFIASCAFALITGTVGFVASFLFIRKIYGLIKVD